MWPEGATLRFRGSHWFLILVLFQTVLAFNCGQNSPVTIVPVNDPSAVSVTVSPGTAAVTTGQTLQLTANVTGTDKKDVTWTIFSSSTNAGTIDSSGLYKAPGTALLAPVRVQAASVANPTKTAVATVWVVGQGTVSTTNNPLVAKYSITVPDGGSVKVDFGPDASYGLNTLTQPAPTGGGPVNMLVAGMRASSTYHMQATVDLPGGLQFQDADHTFQTGAVPSTTVTQMNVTTSSTLSPQPGLYMMDFVGAGAGSTLLQAVAVDLEGNVIWYYPFDSQNGHLIVNPIKLLPNGHLMMIIGPPSQSAVGNPYDDYSVLREIDLAGNTIRQISIPELNQKLSALGVTWTALDMHHDFVYIPEGTAKGHVVVLVNHAETVGGTQVLGDALVDLDKNFNPDWVWDTFDHLDVNRHPYSATDWTHSNGLDYSPDDGNLLLSVRLQAWVVKIDFEDGQGSGDILWRFGYQGDFTMENGGSVDWPYAAHYPIILSPNSTGTFKFGMFDNGTGRVMSDGTICGTSGAPACYSRVPIFSIDEATKSTQVLWQDILPMYSPILGSIQVLKNNDITFDIGDYNGSPREAHVLEVTQETSPQVVWELDETGLWAYRAEHLPSLYPSVQW